jgi:hypothetical protein
MSVFSSIMSRVFGSGDAKAATPEAPAAADPSQASPPPPSAGEAGRAGGQMASAAAAAPSMPPPGASAPSAAPVEPVDVEAVLTALAARNPQKLDWRHSIVDLMKLLDLDSSLGARKELAEELGFSGPKDGSAEMNLWLHRAVMRRLAENGGRVPEDLKS